MCKLKPFKVVFYDFDKERTDLNEAKFNSLDELENHQVLVEAKNSTYKGCKFAYFYFIHLGTRLNLSAKYGKTVSGHRRLLGYVDDDTDKETIDALLSVAYTSEKFSPIVRISSVKSGSSQMRR